MPEPRNPKTRDRQPPARPPAARNRTARSGEPRATVFPAFRQCLDPRGPYLIPLLLLVVSRIVAAAQLPNGAEDAYITYRYAQHWAFGGGLVYNPGERVMGFSSPLWTAWNALGFLVAHQPLPWSRVTSIAADAVTLLVTGLLLERHVSRAAAWCFTAFFAVWPYFPAVSVSGLETSMLVMLVPLSAALAATGRAAGGVALGALALTRPEGLVAALVLAAGARRGARLVALAIVGAGLGALGAYFGTIVPQSVIAKASTYGTPGPWAGRGWWEWLLPFPLGHWPELPDTLMLLPLAVLFAPAVVLGASELWRRRTTPLAHVAAAALVVWLGYAVLGVAYFWWYLALPLAGFAIVASVGFPRLTRSRALYVSVALYVVGVWSMARFLYIGRAQQESRMFAVAAQALAGHATPGDKAMLEPIGMIGYTAPVVVIDEVGLVSPKVAQRRREGPGWYADIVAAERPEWLVVRYATYHAGAAFAGAGAPFRTMAERDSVFARYQVIDGGREGSPDDALVILRQSR